MKLYFLFFLLLLLNFSAFSQNDKIRLGVHAAAGIIAFDQQEHEEYSSKINVIAGLTGAYEINKLLDLRSEVYIKTRNYHYYSQIFLNFPDASVPVRITSDQDFTTLLSGLSIAPVLKLNKWPAGAGMYFDYFIKEAASKAPTVEPDDQIDTSDFLPYENVKAYNLGWTAFGGRKFSLLSQEFEVQATVNHLLSDRYSDAYLLVDGSRVHPGSAFGEPKYYEFFLKVVYWVI